MCRLSLGSTVFLRKELECLYLSERRSWNRLNEVESSYFLVHCDPGKHYCKEKFNLDFGYLLKYSPPWRRNYLVRFVNLRSSFSRENKGLEENLKWKLKNFK